MNRKWYVLRTIPGKEPEAAELMKLFRTQGDYLLGRKDIFPGYLFICTDSPQELAKELMPIKDEDLKFLEHDMRLSTVRVDEQG